jgi:hypothetical protein
MPSSGYPSEDILPEGTPQEVSEAAQYVIECAQHAMEQGLFIEWLESFMGAWKVTKSATDAAQAGLIEWDM